MGMPVEEHSTVLRHDIATMLKDVLQALCSQTAWSYAVLWKLQRRNRMVLIWEDGFYQPSGAQGAGTNVQGVQRISQGQGIWPGDVSAGEDPLRMVIAKMSYQVFYYGEGVIGKAAITGKYQWIFSGGDNGALNGFGPGQPVVRPRMEKYPAGWDSQFAAGIKTIAVVAVAQGVVQLGSTEKILEDPRMVEHIRSLFLKLQDSLGQVGSNRCHELVVSQGDPISALVWDTLLQTFLTDLQCKRDGALEGPISCKVNNPVFLPSSGPGRGPDWSVRKLSKSSGTHAPSAIPALQDRVLSKAAPKGVEDTAADACLSSSDHPAENPALKLIEPPCGIFSPYQHKGAAGVDYAAKKLRSIQNDQDFLAQGVEKSPQSVDNEEVASKTCRKRSRLCENVRPRPKDRQQIQDRVRELREIIPESNKCSIDSLLERTVRHIQFLDSVTQLRDCNRGRKPKDGIATEVMSQESLHSTWNLDGRSCNPLIVEDLSYPRHMLVEILFEKRSLLAGIAENIRGLGLTIIKGVMEVKRDKVRACFVVEAAKDTHKLEVFWTLAHFVEQMERSTTSSGGECPLGSEMLRENWIS